MAACGISTHHIKIKKTGANKKTMKAINMMLLHRIFTYRRSSTSRGQTPASITAWILSLVPSDKYDRAQHASVRTSSSLEWISRASAGRAGLVYNSQRQSRLR